VTSFPLPVSLVRVRIGQARFRLRKPTHIVLRIGLIDKVEKLTDGAFYGDIDTALDFCNILGEVTSRGLSCNKAVLI